MASIYDYLKWRGDLSFKNSPFNEVDNLILSELAYINLDGIFTKKTMSIKETLDTFFERYNEKQVMSQFPLSQNPIPFFKELANSKRFGNLKITNYVNQISKEEAKQFSGLIIKINFNTVYIAFKGTDNTLVGWKEDFNMSYMNIVPSQKEAVNFVNHNVRLKYRHIYLGGHSKGGNLAVYAAVTCKKKIQRRIKCVFNNDGPGFLDDFIVSSNYVRMVPKIITILPETSIIGMLLNHKGEYKVVKSNATGIWQHDSLSWQVSKDHFITIKEVDETSNKIRLTITKWLQKSDKKQREVFINTLFNLLSNNNIDTIEELAKMRLRKIPGLMRSFTKIDAETKKIIVELLKELMREANKNFDRKTILNSLKSIKKKTIINCQTTNKTLN